MTDDTLRLISQEIRHHREALQARVHWLQRQPEGPMRREGFQHVNFWRNVMRDAEQRLQGMTAEVEPVAVHESLT